MEGISVFLVGWCICGVYPISRSNSVFFVVAEGHEFWYTEQVGAMCANCFAGCHRRRVDIVQAFDWFFRLLHLFGGDMLY